MKKTTVIPRKRPGPAPTGKGQPVVVRMQPPALAILDRWIEKQKEPYTRPEAVRRLVELGLTVRAPARSVSKRGGRQRAQELAANAIEKMIDPAAPPEERAHRRRSLTKGPPEFREDRVDLPKAKR